MKPYSFQAARTPVGKGVAAMTMPTHGAVDISTRG
jgi:hypothetical protein